MTLHRLRPITYTELHNIYQNERPAETYEDWLQYKVNCMEIMARQLKDNTREYYLPIDVDKEFQDRIIEIDSQLTYEAFEKIHTSDICWLITKLKKYHAALKYYANEDWYKDLSDWGCSSTPNIIGDKGSTARDALGVTITI